MSEQHDIVIVGGGLTGLSAAYYAWTKAKENGQEVRIALVEQGERLGGKIDTLHRDDCVIERGPDSFLARKLPMIELAKDIGMESELVATNPKAKKTYILCHGKLHRMPQGLVLGIPTDTKAFLKSGLVSPKGKLQAMRDMVIKPKMTTEDESLGHFLNRRLGEEVMHNISEPLLAGIYAGDMNKLSLKATFPQFAEVEREYGSLIKGMQATRQKGQSVPGLPDVAKGTMFLTFRQGLGSLVDKLEEILKPHIAIHTGVSVMEIKRSSESGYELELSNDTFIQAKHLIVTTPAFAAAPLLKPYLNVEPLDHIRYVSVANVVSAFDKDKMTGAWDDGTGFVIARHEGRAITAMTWTSTKWTHTSPQDTVLIRCYVGRADDEERVDWPDEALKHTVLNELAELMKIHAEPRFMEVTRLKHSMPQYPVGHVEAIAAFREALKTELPGVMIAGAAYDGVGLPDCIKSGRTAGEEAVLQCLKEKA
ncbi:protoporphyrinogen oxidase [Paenibacillus sp. 1001270B_150601_E10]|uniref:protoporphyrinogen oxidase n=1 Tax=Paenibacillus sp. 1001270B_150601_E10 TaxID=2787079 RepID=UPI00189E3847|nr:protoporphyrinogen oxidase [Paenibacillus sp. 1001270B_150601_E10]